MANQKTKTTCELYRDNFQNYKRYHIPKAQLVIADIPYRIGVDAFASNPSWYEGGDNKVNYIAASESVSIDTTQLRKTSGELYIKLLNDYPKITKRSASLRVSFKK